MAKTNRQLITFFCTVCKNKNYTTEKNVINSKDKLALSKFCKRCQKHTSHDEGKIK